MWRPAPSPQIPSILDGRAPATGSAPETDERIGCAWLPRRANYTGLMSTVAGFRSSGQDEHDTSLQRRISCWHTVRSAPVLAAGSEFTRAARKRVFGYLSWRFRRRHEHRIEGARCLRADLQAACFDHIRRNRRPHTSGSAAGFRELPLGWRALAYDRRYRGTAAI